MNAKIILNSRGRQTLPWQDGWKTKERRKRPLPHMQRRPRSSNQSQTIFQRHIGTATKTSNSDAQYCKKYRRRHIERRTPPHLKALLKATLQRSKIKALLQLSCRIKDSRTR